MKYIKRFSIFVVPMSKAIRPLFFNNKKGLQSPGGLLNRKEAFTNTHQILNSKRGYYRTKCCWYVRLLPLPFMILSNTYKKTRNFF